MNIIGSRQYADACKMTDEELLKKLTLNGIKLDRESLEKLVEAAPRASKAAFQALKNRQFTSKQKQGHNQEMVFACILELWRRWFPEKPCFELAELKIKDGYERFEANDEAGAMNLWEAAFADIMDLAEKHNICKTKDLDLQFDEFFDFNDWLSDVFCSSWNLGLADGKQMQKRADLSRALLERFKDEKDIDATIGYWRNGLAESLVELGQGEQSQALYRQWLTENPDWTWGWIAWADTHEDSEKTEAILKEAIEVEAITDKTALYNALSCYYKRTGNEGEHEKYAALEEESRKAFAPARLLGLAEQNDAGQVNSAFSQVLSQLLQMAPPAAAMSGRVQPRASASGGASGSASASSDVGRKQPCPCGSGKKFKRCCGSG